MRELDRADDRRVDRLGRHAEAARDERAQLVDDRQVAARGQHVQERLRREHLPDRRGERRPPHLGADVVELLDHLVEPVACTLRAQRRIDACDEAGGQVVLRRAHGDARRERGDGLVADVLVDDVRGIPERCDVDARVEAHADERLRERLARDAVQRQREREDRAGDQLCAGACGRERRREGAAARALDVDADRQPARLGERADEVLRPVRLERAGRVVQEHADGAELGQRLRALDERVDRARRAGAVDEPRLEVAFRGDDRLGGLAQVRDVVQRVVQAEDVDAVLGGRRDEAAREVGVDRTRADEEAAAEGEPERRLHARLQRADALPRALDAALDGPVEAAAAGDLEVGEPGAVEDLGEPELLGGRDLARERLLPEQADGGVGERRHGSGPTAPRAPSRAGGVDPCAGDRQHDGGGDEDPALGHGQGRPAPEPLAAGDGHQHEERGRGEPEAVRDRARHGRAAVDRPEDEAAERGRKRTRERQGDDASHVRRARCSASLSDRP